MPDPSAVTPDRSSHRTGPARDQAARGALASDPGPAEASSVAAASGLRRAILIRLRQDGPCSPDRLATALGLSRTGVLQQLHALEAAGLVTHESVRHGVGRPRHVYDVADAAQDLFPNNYDGFATGLLAAIRSIGGTALVTEVFAERRRLTRDRLAQRLEQRLPADAPVADRVRELAVIQDEQGYLAEATLSADGTIRIVERNCAIRHVVDGDPTACDAELELFRDVLGADVHRESHIAAGDRCCSYRVGGEPA
jgi:predicted ArsR family transcriptional regulator